MGRGGGGAGRSGGGGSLGGSRSSGGRAGKGLRGGNGFRGGDGFRPPPPSFHWEASRYRPETHRTVIYHNSGTGRPTNQAILIVLIIAIVFIFSVPALFLFINHSDSSITRSTIERKPLDPQYVTKTDWYTDKLGWIRSGSKLEDGMSAFFRETGVQPYLYLTDTVNDTTSPTADDMEEYANKLYDDLFTDEGHILLLFYEHNSDGQYMTWYICGKMAKTTMDSEACDILLDYIDHYYYSNYDEDEMFSNAFRDAGNRIMSVTKSPVFIIVIAVIILLILVIAFVWWQKSKRQKNLEAERRERILNTNVHSFGNDDVRDTEKKYMNGEDKNT